MNKYKLSNDQLEIDIQVPDNTYKGTRFDRMGMVTSVTLDQKDHFSGVESLVKDQGSGGQGFYNEFGIEDPIGYHDLAVNKDFLKIGVGALTRTEAKDYDFFYNYPFKIFPHQVIKDENRITFIQKTNETNGYGVLYEKTIALHGRDMVIQYKLKNTGQKHIRTTEYCHNFISINNHPIGPDYKVSFSYPVAVDQALGQYQLEGKSLTWQAPLKEVLYLTLKSLPTTCNQYFEVLHQPSGVGVRESHDFPLHKVAIWAMPHVVSPEAFVKINLKPGDCFQWQRRYTFFNL